MKTWKLVSGILSIALYGFVVFQSCAADPGNTPEANGEVSGTSGLIIAILLLSGGIVSIATRNDGKGGNIALIIIFGIASLVGFLTAGSYVELNVWADWCLICAFFGLIALIRSGKKAK